MKHPRFRTALKCPNSTLVCNDDVQWTVMRLSPHALTVVVPQSCLQRRFGVLYIYMSILVSCMCRVFYNEASVHGAGSTGIHKCTSINSRL